MAEMEASRASSHWLIHKFPYSFALTWIRIDTHRVGVCWNSGPMVSPAPAVAGTEGIMNSLLQLNSSHEIQPISKGPLSPVLKGYEIHIHLLTDCPARCGSTYTDPDDLALPCGKHISSRGRWPDW